MCFVNDDWDVVEFEVSEHSPNFLNAGGTSRGFPGTDFPQVSNKGACQTSEPEKKESLPYAISLNATAEIRMSSKREAYEFGYRNLGIVEMADGT